MRKFLSGALAVALLVVASVVLLVEPAKASTTYTFSPVPPGDGHTWSQAKNWDPEGTPQDGDSVLVDGNFHIVGVPTISLESLQVSGDQFTGGPSLVGATSTITTKILQWTQGTIAANLVVSTAGQMLAFGVDPPRIPPTLSNASTPVGAPAVTLTNNGSIAQSGTLGLASGVGGARILNEGTWAAGPGTIASSHCCIDPGTFVNDGALTLAGNLTIDHARFRAQPNSSVSGVGTLDNLGGIPELNGPWSVNGPDTTFSLSSVEAATIQGTTTIGSGAKLVQRGSSKIMGKGVFGGSGVYRWFGGVIYADLTLSSTLTSVFGAPTFHELSDRFSTGGPGLLTVEGTVTQQDVTDIRMNGKIVNKGTWHVPSDAIATVIAGGLGNPPKQFRNEGSIKVDDGGVLLLGSLGYSNPANKGVIEGGGTLQLSNGIHELSAGGKIRGPGTELDLLDRAQVHAAGTQTLEFGKLVVKQRSALRGTFTIGGEGDLSLLSATIYADLTTGPHVDVNVVPGDAFNPLTLDAINGTGILRTKGRVVANGGNPFQFTGPARVLNTGTWTMKQAILTGTGCCADPARFVNDDDGSVLINGTASPAAKISSMGFVNRGTTQVSSTAAFNDVVPLLADGRMKLSANGRIENELPLVVSGGVLQGFGTILGSLNNLGIVSPGDGSSLGTIHVGEYHQAGAGHLNLDLKGGGGDRIEARRTLHLAGTLRLTKLGALVPQDRLLLFGIDPRSGTFGTVLGLSTLGSGWHVRYVPTSVRLEHA